MTPERDGGRGSTHDVHFRCHVDRMDARHPWGETEMREKEKETVVHRRKTAPMTDSDTRLLGRHPPVVCVRRDAPP